MTSISPTCQQVNSGAVPWAHPEHGSGIRAAQHHGQNLAATTRGGKRFASLFPVAASLVFRPGVVALATAVVAGLLLPFSVHYAVSAAILGLAAICVYADRRFLDALLITPNLLVARSAVAGGAVGCAYIASGLTESSGWALLAVQASTAYWLVATSLCNRLCLRNIPGISMPWGNQSFRAECLRPLSLIAFTLLMLELARQIVGVVTGGLDRGIYGDDAARQAFGSWTYLSIFPRLTVTCMFLAPVIWRAGGSVLKVCASVTIALLLLIGLSTGSRGLFLTPLVYLFLGAYFFLSLRRVPLETIAAAIVVFVFVPLVLVISSHRSSEEFRQTPGWQVAERVRGFARAATESTSSMDESLTARQERVAFGTQLLGVADQLVYERTPQEVSYAGFDNFERILYVWIPTFFKRDKPYLQDGNDIVVEYTGIKFKRSSATISLMADLYRRFGIIGLVVLVPVAAFVSALFARWVFRVLLFRDAVLGVVLVQLLISSFNLEPWGTVLCSAFEWLYAVPKHLVFAYVLVFAARLATGFPARRGLLGYQPIS